MRYRWSTVGRALAVAGAMLLSAMATPARAEDESLVCNPDGQAFAYGDVLADCTIEVVADLDVFTFQASMGDDVTIVITKTSGSAFSAQCVQLLAPDLTPLASNCGNSRFDTGPLPMSGTYQVVVTVQNNNGTLVFNLSLERLFPLRAPVPIGAGDVLTDREIGPVADLDTFSFNAAPGDVLRLILTKTAGSAFSAHCTEIRGPGNTTFVAMTCGNFDAVLPAVTVAGTYQVIVTAQNNNGTVVFNLSLTCLSDTCAPRPPACFVDPTYAGTTLTFDFTIGTPEPAEWHVAVLALGSVFTLWKAPLPIVDPAAAFSLPIANFPSLGTIGVLSTLTTGSGLACTHLETVDTGPMTAGVTAAELRQYLRQRR